MSSHDPEGEHWRAIHATHRESYRLPPDVHDGLDWNAPSTCSDKLFTIREAEMRVIAAAMDWADNETETEVEVLALEMGITMCLADLAKAYEATRPALPPSHAGEAK